MQQGCVMFIAFCQLFVCERQKEMLQKKVDVL